MSPFHTPRLWGVTWSRWRFYHFSRSGSGLDLANGTVWSHYERTLQTVLNNKIDRGAAPDSLVELSAENSTLHHGAWGLVLLPRGRKKALPVYNGGGRILDLHIFRRRAAADWPWVRSCRVFTTKTPLVRPMHYAELMGT